MFLPRRYGVPGWISTYSSWTGIFVQRQVLVAWPNGMSLLEEYLRLLSVRPGFWRKFVQSHRREGGWLDFFSYALAAGRQMMMPFMNPHPQQPPSSNSSSSSSSDTDEEPHAPRYRTGDNGLLTSSATVCRVAVMFLGRARPMWGAVGGGFAPLLPARVRVQPRKPAQTSARNPADPETSFDRGPQAS
jgi:hypothetical protein